MPVLLQVQQVQDGYLLKGIRMKKILLIILLLLTFNAFCSLDYKWKKGEIMLTSNTWSVSTSANRLIYDNNTSLIYDNNNKIIQEDYVLQKDPLLIDCIDISQEQGILTFNGTNVSVIPSFNGLITFNESVAANQAGNIPNAIVNNGNNLAGLLFNGTSDYYYTATPYVIPNPCSIIVVWKVLTSKINYILYNVSGQTTIYEYGSGAVYDDPISLSTLHTIWTTPPLVPWPTFVVNTFYQNNTSGNCAIYDLTTQKATTFCTGIANTPILNLSASGANGLQGYFMGMWIFSGTPTQAQINTRVGAIQLEFGASNLQ